MREFIQRCFPKFVIGLIIVAAVLLLRLPSMQNVINLIVGIAWPAVALIALLWFRPQVGDLLGRVKKIGKEGAEFDGQQQLPPRGSDPSSATPVTQAAPTVSAPVAGGQKPSVEALIAPAFRSLHAQLKQRIEDQFKVLRNQYSGTETEIMMGVAAELAAALYLERSSRSIFQSQVDALDGLKWQTTTKQAFKPYYDRAVSLNATFYANYPFDEWFKFLVAFGLIAGADDDISVTPVGESVKMYMAQQGYKAPAL